MEFMTLLWLEYIHFCRQLYVVMQVKLEGHARSRSFERPSKLCMRTFHFLNTEKMLSADIEISGTPEFCTTVFMARARSHSLDVTFLTWVLVRKTWLHHSNNIKMWFNKQTSSVGLLALWLDRSAEGQGQVNKVKTTRSAPATESLLENTLT